MKFNENAYSLISVLASLAIIVLIVGLSLPHIRAYQINSRLSAEAREMAGNLRYTKQLSVTEQVVHGVEFDIEQDLYRIKSYGEATTTIRTISLDSSVNLSEVSGLDDNRLKFNFYGGVRQGGEVVLKNSDLSTKVIIKPSGYVKLE